MTDITELMQRTKLYTDFLLECKESNRIVTNPDTQCVLWRGSYNKTTGLPYARIEKKVQSVVHWLWKCKNDKIERSMCLENTCDCTLCLNLSHWRVVPRPVQQSKLSKAVVRTLSQQKCELSMEERWEALAGLLEGLAKQGKLVGLLESSHKRCKKVKTTES